MFLLSSQNFYQAYKRLQYLKQYTSFRKNQGEEILFQSTLVHKLTDSLLYQKKIKDRLLLSEKDEINEHRFLGKLIYIRPDGVKVYASDSKQLVSNIQHWYYNRPLNKDHVQSLVAVSLDKKCLEGVIDILESEEDELCVVNGQHRVESIKEISKKDDKFNQLLIVNVHPVKSFESEEAEKIFLATNNIQNVEMRDRPQKKLQNICKRMIERYPNGITKNPSGKANLH